MENKTSDNTADKQSVEIILASLKGKSAWGLVRTHGSMFFLEVGAPMPRPSLKKVHGEWHFLIQMCHWRIESSDAAIVGSDDDQALIDRTFTDMRLGRIADITCLPPSHDLHILFDLGLKLATFTTEAAPDSNSPKWYLYCPNDDVVTVDGLGHIDIGA